MIFCIAIDAPLAESTCPLEKGACYWQHRGTKDCCYTEQELTVEEFKARVGSNDPVSDIDEFRDRLRMAL